MILSLKMTNFDLTYQSSNFDPRKKNKKLSYVKFFEISIKTSKIQKNLSKMVKNRLFSLEDLRSDFLLCFRVRLS